MFSTHLKRTVLGNQTYTGAVRYVTPLIHNPLSFAVQQEGAAWRWGARERLGGGSCPALGSGAEPLHSRRPCPAGAELRPWPRHWSSATARFPFVLCHLMNGASVGRALHSLALPFNFSICTPLLYVPAHSDISQGKHSPALSPAASHGAVYLPVSSSRLCHAGIMQ